MTTLIVILVLLLVFVYLLFPGHASRKKRAPFWGRNFAHRGLFLKDQSVPENSLEAFRRAVAGGYGMELDVQLSKDGQVVVFHDDTLERVCGVKKRVDALTFAELRELRLCSTEEQIPLFSEVLETVGGKTPLIVELKNGPRNRELCEKTCALLAGYAGDACIESFNPLIVTWFRFHDPKRVRGFLSQPPRQYRKSGMMPLTSIVLGCTLTNFLARPQFIAYMIGSKPFPVHLAERLGAIRTVWTSHDAEAEKSYDIVIFEHYNPETVYKKEA